MNISVIGSGYVGLVSGVCLADKGHRVICVDKDRNKIETINRGMTPIYEKGLQELLKKNINRNFKATTDLREALLQTDISIIAIGTPFDGSEIDLSYVINGAQEIGEILKEKCEYHVVMVKSTVVPGTTDNIILPGIEKASGKKAGLDFGIGMNPEFLREGEAVEDFMNPDRIVLGGIDERTIKVMEKAYDVFDNVDIVKTNTKTAEMIKYTANSLLATMISFSNEIGNLCAAIGDIDVVDVMNGVYKDKRLSLILEDGSRIKPGLLSYLEAGCGFGGSCLPKDVNALIAHGKKYRSSMILLDSVMKINAEQPKKIIALVKKHIQDLSGVPITVLGLAFKPGTNDMRESPAIPVIKELVGEGAWVNAYDPIACKEAESVLGNHQIVYYTDLESSVMNAEVIVLLTRWTELQKLPEQLKKRKQKPPIFIDARRMFNKCLFDIYEGIGV